MAKKRDYKREYNRYQGTPEQKKRRAARGRARYAMEKKGRVKLGDSTKDVIHKDGNPTNNSPSNLGVQRKGLNRSFARTKTGGKVNATD